MRNKLKKLNLLKILYFIINIIIYIILYFGKSIYFLKQSTLKQTLCTLSFLKKNISLQNIHFLLYNTIFSIFFLFFTHKLLYIKHYG